MLYMVNVVSWMRVIGDKYDNGKKASICRNVVLVKNDEYHGQRC